jgi:hypothetical protein
MSASRRAAAADDNILARLERDAKRGSSASSWKNHATLAWCALAAMAIIGLIGVLASLAKENLASHRKFNLSETQAAPDLVATGGFAPLPAAERRMAMPIAPMADIPPEPATPPSLVRNSVPPLVMLPAPARTAVPVAKNAAEPLPPVRVAATRHTAEPLPPVRVAAAKPTAKPLPPTRIAAAKPAAKTTPAKPSTAPSRPASPAVSAPPRPVIALAPARPKKAAVAPAPAKAEPAAVDSDVALLSAIIMHASRHSAERAQIEAAQCGAGKKCPSSSDAAAAALKDPD